MAKEKPNKEEKARSGILDENFVLIFRYVWLILRFIYRSITGIFKLFYKLILKLSKKDSPAQDLKNADFSQPLNPTPVTSNLIDQRNFLNYGSTRWVCDYTPAALQKTTREKFPQAEIINIEFVEDKEIKTFEVHVYGKAEDAQIVTIENTIQAIIAEKKMIYTNLHEIYLIEDMGKLLNQQGVAENNLLAFSLDEHGSMLLLQEAAFDAFTCDLIFREVLNDDVNYMAARRKARESLWNQADGISERLQKSSEYRPPDTRYYYGSFRGHHIIDLDSKIRGGVYLGLPAREALVVETESEVLDSIFSNLLKEIRKIKEPLGINLEEKIMLLTISLVQQKMPRNTPEALKLLRSDSRNAADDEMSLDVFIKRETGDADHLALLIGYLLERLANDHDHYISGKVSIDRNWLPGGGHTWIRYAHSPGDIYIIDPIKSYFGRLDDYSIQRWPYERPEDLGKPRKRRPIIPTI